MFPHKQSSDSSSVSEEKNQLPIKNQSFLQYQLADTPVPIGWYCSTIYYVPKLVLKCFVFSLTIRCHREGRLLSNLFTLSFTVLRMP